jgi:hypothetical protein
MMMMRTGQILEHQAVDGAVLAMTMTMTTARVRRTRRAARKGPEKRRDQRMGRGTGRGSGREMVKGNVLLNSIRQTRTQRANKSGYI